MLTSLPFVAVGAHMLARRRTPEGRQHAWSMVAVGATATVYHAASGRARDMARKADYWVIAASSIAMVRVTRARSRSPPAPDRAGACRGHRRQRVPPPAPCPAPAAAFPQVKSLFADQPRVRAVLNASYALVPFRPLWVTAANTLAMQAQFVREAAAHEGVRPALRAHLLAAGAGATAFAAEEALTERGVRGVHAIWHLLSCAAVTSMCGLMAHSERQQLAGRFAAALAERGGAAAAAGGGLRRSASDGSLFGADCDGGSLCSPLGSADDCAIGVGKGRLRRPLHSSAASLYGLAGGSPPAGASPPRGASPVRRRPPASELSPLA